MREDFLETARLLAQSSSRRPRLSDLRRAVSTAYYAAFTSLAGAAADSLAGSSFYVRQTERWSRLFRALSHSDAKRFFDAALNVPARSSIHRLGRNFVELQSLRHKADYDPTARFTRLDAESAIRMASEAISDLTGLSDEDWKDLAVDLLFKKR